MYHVCPIQLGLHRISNPDPNNYAISLHRTLLKPFLFFRHIILIFYQYVLTRNAYLRLVYTPPNAAHYGFSIFDEKTGHSRHIKQCEFYSCKGKKL